MCCRKRCNVKCRSVVWGPQSSSCLAVTYHETAVLHSLNAVLFVCLWFIYGFFHASQKSHSANWSILYLVDTVWCFLIWIIFYTHQNCNYLLVFGKTSLSSGNLNPFWSTTFNSTALHCEGLWLCPLWYHYLLQTTSFHFWLLKMSGMISIRSLGQRALKVSLMVEYYNSKSF